MLPSELVQYKKNSKKIIALTAWDSISGSLAEISEADIVLVGDSLAMVSLGYKSTLPVTLDNMIYHTNAVSRGFSKDLEDQPLIVCDMPFLTYQCGEDKAVESAGKIIKETYAKAVKGAGTSVFNTLDNMAAILGAVKEIAEGLQKYLDSNGINSFFIRGNEWTAGNLCYHLKSRPKCLIVNGKEDVEIYFDKGILSFKQQDLKDLK